MAPRISCPTDRPNFFECTDDTGISYYQSYQTLVAFQHPQEGWLVCENQWGTTTGKHLNYIDGGSQDAKRARIPQQELIIRYEECVAAIKEATVKKLRAEIVAELAKKRRKRKARAKRRAAAVIAQDPYAIEIEGSTTNRRRG